MNHSNLEDLQSKQNHISLNFQRYILSILIFRSADDDNFAEVNWAEIIDHEEIENINKFGEHYWDFIMATNGPAWDDFSEQEKAQGFDVIVSDINESLGY